MTSSACLTNQHRWTVRYHVPWSQVHPGSGGGQSGNVHLHAPLVEIDGEHDGPCDNLLPDGSRSGPCAKHLAASRRRRAAARLTLVAVAGRRTNVTRDPGAALCGKGGGWMEREPTARELADGRCPRCVTLADRYGVPWPLPKDDTTQRVEETA